LLCKYLYRYCFVHSINSLSRQSLLHKKKIFEKNILNFFFLILIFFLFSYGLLIFKQGEDKWTNSYQGKCMPFPSQWPSAGGSDGERQQVEEQRVNKLTIGLPGFTHMPPPTRSAGPTVQVLPYKGADGFDPVSPVSASTGGNMGLQMPHQQHRKARRCWSPELHRLFVSALNQLGGAQGQKFSNLILIY
jgi:hypothetical protein